MVTQLILVQSFIVRIYVGQQRDLDVKFESLFFIYTTPKVRKKRLDFKRLKPSLYTLNIKI